MTQEETPQIDIKQTSIKYDYKVLLEKLNKQMDVLISIQFGYSNHTLKRNYNKYLFAILKNIENICQSFNRHYEVTNEEFKTIEDKIKEIRDVLKNNLNLNFNELMYNELMSVLLNDLLEIIFNLSLWEDYDIEDDDDDDDDNESEDEKFIESNSQIPDHASIINIENDNKKRKCNVI